MSTVYFERRISSARGTDSIAADLMRHFHARQHLGKVTVVCDQPITMLSAARKQWLKLARHAQKQRASTLNADKILKYTHTITRMQNMRFTLKDPREYPEADVFFITPEMLSTMCVSQTVYITAPVNVAQADVLMGRIADEGLLVDYDHTLETKAFALKPKKTLEREAMQQWERLQELLGSYGINPRRLNNGGIHDIDAMDDALDTLLNISRTFMQAASDFHHSLELARPLRTTKEMRQQFDAVMLLAHRVQALSTGAFTQRFLEIYNEDDTFYLYDNRLRVAARAHETLHMAITRHMQAGRNNLAAALQQPKQSLEVL